MLGIPTSVDGLIMRSRLEAKWAHLFTSLGWSWQYEPIDLDGYIPDFVVSGKLGRRFLVEVKPFIDIHERNCSGMHCGACPQCVMRKIDASGWIGDAVIVGSSPILVPFSHAGGCNSYGPVFGWHGQWQGYDDREGGVRGWGGCDEWSFCNRCRLHTFVNRSMGWDCSHCGEYLGKDGTDAEELTSWWRSASNAAAWMGRR